MKRKIIATTCAGLLLASGVAFATHTIYEKIWKEPKKYDYTEESNKFSENEIIWNSKFISEEEATDTANKVLNIFNYNNYNIAEVQIYEVNGEDILKDYYKITAKKNEELTMKVDAKNAKLMSFSNNETYLNMSSTENINSNEAIVFVEEVMEKLGLGDYQLNTCEETNFVFENNNTKKWTATFNKIVDGMVNPYDNVTIKFLKKNNQIKIIQFIKNEDEYFENNPIIISEEIAIETAVNKEKEFGNTNINSISSSLGIRRMNTYIYELENGINRVNTDINSDVYITEHKTRKVWIVTVELNNDNAEIINLFKQGNKKYYIDATTGEIIGGMDNLGTKSPIY